MLGSIYDSTFTCAAAINPKNQLKLIYCKLISHTRLHPIELDLECIMAAAPALPLSGPPQRGDSVQGQYVYALIMPQPTPEIIAQTGVKQPSDFDRATFRVMVVQRLAECDIEVIETACVQPHTNRDPHLPSARPSRSKVAALAAAWSQS